MRVVYIALAICLVSAVAVSAQDDKCVAEGGNCANPWNCAGTFVRGVCSNAGQVCCVTTLNKPQIEKSCGNGGTCVSVDDCGGNARPDLCPANQVCCEPIPDSASDSAAQRKQGSIWSTIKDIFTGGKDDSSSSSSSSSGSSSKSTTTSTQCAAKNGKCQSTSSCLGTVQSGICPGSSSITCCIPTSFSVSAFSYTGVTTTTLNIRAGVTTSTAIQGSLASGTTVEFNGKATGASVNGNTVWYRLADGRGFISSYYVKKASSTPTQPTTPTTPSNPGTVSGNAKCASTIVAKGLSWVTAKVPYCQAANGGKDVSGSCPSTCRRPQVAAWDPYRSDCSGFVSYTWGLAAPGLSTRGFAPTSTSVSKIIYMKDLKPGDALITSGHIMLFVRWSVVNSQAVVYHEPGCSGSINYASERTVPIVMDSQKKAGTIWGSSYQAIRYDNVDHNC